MTDPEADDRVGELAPGTLFQGRYEIIRCLGKGGMGAVYEVLHQQTDRRRALKIMLPGMASSAEARRRFEREAKVTAGIDSEHIAEVLDAGVDPSTASPFFVMELLRGRELGELLAERGRLDPALTMTLVRQAGLGLDKAHRKGIVHRDLKPENIFVSLCEDGSPRVKLLDFGIAKVLNGTSGANLTQGVMGTPRYIAPEQVTGASRVGAAADLYALALVTYTCLAGEGYFSEEIEASETMMQILSRVMFGPLESASVRARRRRGVELPEGFDDWFRRGAHVSADKRFASAAEMFAALAALLPAAEPAPARLSDDASVTLASPREVVTRPSLIADAEPSLPDGDATVVASASAILSPAPPKRSFVWGLAIGAAFALALGIYLLAGADSTSRTQGSAAASSLDDTIDRSAASSAGDPAPLTAGGEALANQDLVEPATPTASEAAATTASASSGRSQIRRGPATRASSSAKRPGYQLPTIDR